MNTINKIAVGGNTYEIVDTWRPVSDSVSSTSSSDAASSKAVKTAYDLAAGKTSNTGTVTSVAAGTGLSGGTITTSGTLSVSYGTTAGTACQGNDSRLSDARPASDVYAWAKASSKPSYSYSEISGTPGSLPASDVYEWAKASTKPSYAYSEISGTPSSLPASDVSAWAKASSKPTYIANEVMSISTVAIIANTSSSCSITGSGNAGKAQTIIYTNSGSADLTVTVPTDYTTPDGAAIELTCKAGGYCEVSYLNIGGTIYARGL